MKAEPVSNRVIILPKAEEDIQGGVFVPETAKEAPTLGTAAFVGPDCKQIVVGDTILFPKAYGTEMVLDGQTYLILREDQIHSIIRD